MYVVFCCPRTFQVSGVSVRHRPRRVGGTRGVSRQSLATSRLMKNATLTDSSCDTQHEEEDSVDRVYEPFPSHPLAPSLGCLRVKRPVPDRVGRHEFRLEDDAPAPTSCLKQRLLETPVRTNFTRTDSLADLAAPLSPKAKVEHVTSEVLLVVRLAIKLWSYLGLGKALLEGLHLGAISLMQDGNGHGIVCA